MQRGVNNASAAANATANVAAAEDDRNVNYSSSSTSSSSSSFLLSVLSENLGAKQTDSNKRQLFLKSVLRMCEPEDLAYLSERLDEFRRDFFVLLPIEIVERCLCYLDWKSLLNCCQVNSVWNRKLSTCFNKLWFDLCRKELPLDDEYDKELVKFEADVSLVNYKSLFVEIMKRANRLETGKVFRTWRIGPVEINAMASFGNILATATHRVKFWRLESLSPTPQCLSSRYDRDEPDSWLCFKNFHLQSRASGLKFDSTYLLVSTYFLTMDLYSLSTESLLCQFMGHTCSITAFDFNSDPLQLICTGSADNSVKFWSMAEINCKATTGSVPADPQHSVSVAATDDDPRIPIKTEPNLLWPVKINIELLDSECNEYLVLVLCANGYLYLNLLSIGPFISDSYKSLLNLQASVQDTLINLDSHLEGFFGPNDHVESLIISNRSWIELRWSAIANSRTGSIKSNKTSNSSNSGSINNNTEATTTTGRNNLITAFIITENNSNQSKKMFRQQFGFKKSVYYEMFEFWRIVDAADQVEDAQYEFLNKRMLKIPDIGHFEIVSFGLNYCLFLDESNLFYMCQLKSRTIECIQTALNFDNETMTAFRIHSSNSSQEQYVFGKRTWLNGFRLTTSDEKQRKATNDFVYAFYTHKRNELFIVGWKDPTCY